MKYRKKPVVVVAVQYDGTNNDNILKMVANARCLEKNQLSVGVIIRVLEGDDIQLNIGDYLINDMKGELYSLKPDIFEQTYDKFEE
jgi:hypothetical protein